MSEGAKKSQAKDVNVIEDKQVKCWSIVFAVRPPGVQTRVQCYSLNVRVLLHF